MLKWFALKEINKKPNAGLYTKNTSVKDQYDSAKMCGWTFVSK